jgi:hypothetical protein
MKTLFVQPWPISALYAWEPPLPIGIVPLLAGRHFCQSVEMPPDTPTPMGIPGRQLNEQADNENKLTDTGIEQ